MITGGFSPTKTSNAVTLYNWMTTEQCSLPNLPYNVSAHSMTSSFGVPIFCGGGIPPPSYAGRDTCFKFNMTTKGWDPVSFCFCSFKTYTED